MLSQLVVAPVADNCQLLSQCDVNTVTCKPLLAVNLPLLHLFYGLPVHKPHHVLMTIRQPDSPTLHEPTGEPQSICKWLASRIH